MLEMFQKFCEPVAWTEQQIEAVKEKGEINDEPMKEVVRISHFAPRIKVKAEKIFPHLFGHTIHIL